MFHLVLLRALVAKGEDKGLIALKGGCNLRFFFGSVRYSEDIDFDVVTIATGTLKNKIDRLLRSPVITMPLKAAGIEVQDATAPKQTDTTQRWKVGLRAAHIAVPLRTKIEFSRRDTIQGATFESASREVVRTYGLSPVLATHYALHAAIEQKVSALAGRTEPQARDVFDLQLLLSRREAADLEWKLPRKRVTDAIDHAMGISYDEYRSKVVAYLDPEHAAPNDSRDAWDTMQELVVARIEEMK